MNACFRPFLLWICFVSAVLADYNITYDDTDPSIAYSPSDAWTHVRDDTTKDRYDETTSRTASLGASATLKFSGATAIYVMSYGLASGGEATIYFDQSPLTVSLQSTGNAQAQKIIYTKKLINPNATHTISVSNDRGVSLEIDVFILTLPGDPPQGVTTFPAPTEAAATGPNVGVIAGATVAACIALLVFVGAGFWYLRRRQIRSKAFEPLPLTTTNLLATTSQQAPETRAPATAIRTILPTPSYTTSAEPPVKAEYRGNTIPSLVSGSGSSGFVSSSAGARNIATSIYSSPLSHVTATTIMPPSPSHSPHPLLPPPSYAAAASDVQIHELHPAPE